MAKKTISSNSPPIIWSTVDQAFNDINDNFNEIYAAIGGTGVEFTDLGTDLIPRYTEQYDLGSTVKRWKDLYLSGSSLYLGNAVITASGTALNLPAGSTIGGSVLDNEYFREIAVSGQSNIVADAGGNDVLTITSGNAGITLTTNATTDTLTITNSGVVDITAGNAGISILGTTTKSITNAGVIDVSAGAGITITGTKTNYSIAVSGVISVVTDPGSGITLDTSVANTVRVTNSAPNIVQNTFRYVTVSGDPTIIDSGTGSATLVFGTGSGISLTPNSTAKSVTINNTGVTSLAGNTGISVSNSTGSVNLTNTGVTSLTAGDGMSVSAATGGVTITNTRYGFQNISVAGQGAVQADNVTDTLVLVAGNNVTLTTNPTNDSITINAIVPEENLGLSFAVVDTGSTIVDIPAGQTLTFIAGTNVTLDANPVAGSITINSIGSGGGGVGGGGDFELYVAADDSTLRPIFTGEVIEFLGTAGITTTSDNEGRITIKGSTSNIYGSLSINDSTGNIVISTSGTILIQGASNSPVTLGGGTSGDIIFSSGTQGIDYGDLDNKPTSLLASRAALAGTTASLANAATGNLQITGYKGYMLYKIQTSAAAWVRIYTDAASRSADSARSEGTDPTPGSGVIAEVITTGAQTILISPGAIGFNNESSPTTAIELAVTNKSGGTTTITVTLTAVKLEG
jgi:hypothetical protein